MTIQFTKNRIYLFSFLTATFIVALYFFNNYKLFDSSLSSLDIVLEKPFSTKEMPIMYPFARNENKIDFSKVYKFKKLNDSTIRTSGLENSGIRKFRLYFVNPKEGYVIKRAILSNSKGEALETINVSQFIEGQNVERNDDDSFNVYKKYAYIEYPYNILNTSPISGLVAVISILAFFFGLFISKSDLQEHLGKVRKKNLPILAFIISILLFHPVFNITLIAALLFYIKDFNFNAFWKNWANIWIIILFLLYVASTLFSMQNGLKDFSTVERLLPFVFIPVLFSSVRFGKSLNYLSVCVFIVVTVLFAFSFLDAILLESMAFFSFDGFSKYYHPVYLSYMLFFSLMFTEEEYRGKNKYILQLLLFILLIFLGSKMVIISAIVLYILFYVKLKENVRGVMLLIASLTLVFVLFKPIQERFKEIAHLSDLSVLSEDTLDANDSRINGLTLRLILWREAILTLDSFTEYLIGNGASKSKEVELKNRIIALGLDQHQDYNPHNQFIDTFWRTGALGLIVLVAIPTTCIILGRTHKNKLLMVFGVFMITCMFTESIFGRVRGVYFFVATIILLTNNIIYAKNSDPRD